ncbi:MAG: HAMP domain-containing protein [Proteobacteria bacterium]|nr:HAMP domain-containing protein [Pseudomonadota bacterium]
MIRRLLLGYVAIVLVLAGSLAVPFGIVFADRQREQFATALERDAVVLATVYEDSLQHGAPVNPQPADVYAQRTGARVVVVDSSGVSVVDTGDDETRSFTSRPEIVTALSGNRFSGTRFSQTLGADLFVVAVPVASSASVFGAVRLTVLNRDIERNVQRMWISLGLGVLIAVGATAVVAFAVARSVTRSVEGLRGAAERIADGDLSARASIGDAPPELAALARAFDEMAARVEELVDSQRAFVADASHQLRTPLTALRLRLENLEAAATGDDLDDIADVVFEAERLSRMVDQLLELSREGSTTTIEVDVVDVVGHRVRLWEGPASEKEIALTMSIEDDAPCSAAMVPDGLEQVLDNLLDNAIRYSPSGGSIVVTVERSADGGCSVRVRDDGPGVTEEDRQRLFDRFWRGESDQPGTGLGLSIVSHLMTRAGGSVSASQSIGGGLTISLHLLPGSLQLTPQQRD